MAMLTLGQAARLTGLGKTTITRAIKAGKLSANRREDGSYEIDPSELSRVYEVRPETPETVTEPGRVVQSATPPATPRDGVETHPDVVARLAALEAQLQGLKDLLNEVRQSRDDWKDQASRLVHALPPPEESKATVTPVTPITPTLAEPVRRDRPWWRRLAG
jgi:excisionase family DNA binding protein